MKIICATLTFYAIVRVRVQVAQILDFIRSGGRLIVESMFVAYIRIICEILLLFFSTVEWMGKMS